MDWLAEIIKQLQTSRSFVTAAFVVCFVILFGHIFVPASIPQAPDEWKLVLIAGLLFSGTLLLFMIIPFIYKFFVQSFSNKLQEIKSSNLSQDERDFLYSLALMIEASQDDYINMGNLNYHAMEISKLEIQEIISNLSSKGLIDINSFDNNLVSFTKNGRRKVLEIKSNQHKVA